MLSPIRGRSLFSDLLRSWRSKLSPIPGRSLFGDGWQVTLVRRWRSRLSPTPGHSLFGGRWHVTVRVGIVAGDELLLWWLWWLLLDGWDGYLSTS